MILLDTQAVVWLAEAPRRLSRRAVTAIEKARRDDGLAIADKTLWEIAMAVSRGRLEPLVSLADFLAAVAQEFTVLPITPSIAERSILFSDAYPNDPTDRLIGATALVHAMPLVTADEKIRKSGEVPCIW